MAKLPLLTDILRELGPGVDVARRSRELLLDPSDEQRVVGWLLRAASFYREGSPAGALGALIESRRRLGFYTLPVMANILWLARDNETRQTAAYQCLRFARDALAQGYDHLAVEAYAAALLLDGHAQFELLADPHALCEVGASYEQIARRNRPEWLDGSRRVPGGGERLEVVLLVPNLVDDIVAYTQTVLHCARHHDRSRYALTVLVTENSSCRGKSYFPFGCTAGCTEQSGRETLEELRDLGVRVVVAPRSSAFIEGAREVAGLLRDGRFDAVLALTGLACPLDWLALRWSDVPVKTALHLGCSLFMPGLDATFYDNPANIEREAGVWQPVFGERVVISLGVEMEPFERALPFDREEVGVPADAVVAGVLSNHLDKRLSSPYLRGLAEVLRACPQAWFLAWGRPPPSLRVPDCLEGVRDRIVFGGIPSDKARALKTLDVYANEFPVGGSTSVMEAAASGLPIVAMRAGRAHAESAGAEIAGEEDAVQEYAPERYFERLGQLLRSPRARAEAGERMRRRALERFAAPRCVGELLDRLDGLVCAKRGRQA